jgi:SAM-dependent methyltransferase
MNTAHTRPNEFQTRLWNGAAGDAWVDAQEMLDGMYQPFNDRLVEAVVRRSARRVLDVGCGTGSTTRDIQRRLEPAGLCTGIDISHPMLELAQNRSAAEGLKARFVAADAQVHDFMPGSFDMIVSRFGVMFFDKPVSAFANLRRAAMSDASLLLAVWRSAADNPFMTAAEHAAASLLPAMPTRSLDGPGQFAFADPGRTQRMLEDSGWRQIQVSPLDVDCAFPAEALDYYLTRLGPVGVALRDADDATRGKVITAVHRAMAPYIKGDQVRYNAACWLVSAVA